MFRRIWAWLFGAKAEQPTTSDRLERFEAELRRALERKAREVSRADEFRLKFLVGLMEPWEAKLADRIVDRVYAETGGRDGLH